jgi:outer membrane receptor protein involved in Fe transport
MRSHLARLLASGAVLIGMPATVWSQAVSSEDNDVGSDIIGTARCIDERLQDVPISIAVSNQQQLDNRNLTTTADLAQFTASLAANVRWGVEKATFSIRGFNQDAYTAPTVGVYFAEVAGVCAQGGTESGRDVGADAFMDLQNAQVLKGPQGSLFGRNSTGGAILLVPCKPSDELSGYVERSVGNYHLSRVQGALNVPLADTFNAQLAGDHYERDRYLRNASVTLFNNLQFDFGYAYLDTEVQEVAVPQLNAGAPFADITTAVIKGDPLPLSPKNRVALSATSTLPVDESLGRISLGATFTHSGEQRATTPDSLALRFLVVMPSTDLLDLSFNWRQILRSCRDVSVFATNLTNRIYPVDTGGGYSSAGGYGTWVMAPPRMYGAPALEFRQLI